MSRDRFNAVLVYTMTAGLGDYLVMGDLMRKAERLIPGSKCYMVHRANPHVGLWQGAKGERFFNVYSPADMGRLVFSLRRYRKDGAAVFGLQMAPGSWQGYILHSMLKRLGAIDHTVEFNLANGDIITPSNGNYILDIHLNQIGKLFGIVVPPAMLRLDLPLLFSPLKSRPGMIGIHPWSRRGGVSFTWPWDKWLGLISFIVKKGKDIVVFGKDPAMPAFKEYLAKELPADVFARVFFEPSESVPSMVAQIASLEGIITVNTAVVHVASALGKRMVILNGPTLDIWVPKGKDIVSVYDRLAKFPGGDKPSLSSDLPQVARIEVEDVSKACAALL